MSNATGTEEAGIMNFLNGKGFRVWMTYDMTVDSLVNFIETEIPVILIIQAWSRSKREDKYESFANYGHYVLAIGHDDDRVIFMDSGLPFSSYGYLTKEELEKRWYYVSEDKRRLRGRHRRRTPQKEQPRSHPVGKPFSSPAMIPR